MASVQCHKPCDQAKTSTTINEHSFSNKVKEMAHSARKMFTHQQHQGPVTSNGSPAPNQTQKFPSNGTAQDSVKSEKKKMMKKPDQGHGGNCMPKMREHMKNMKKKKKNEDKRSGRSSSDSGSSSESDNEKSKKKNQEK